MKKYIFCLMDEDGHVYCYDNIEGFFKEVKRLGHVSSLLLQRMR